MMMPEQDRHRQSRLISDMVRTRRRPVAGYTRSVPEPRRAETAIPSLNVSLAGRYSTHRRPPGKRRPVKSYIIGGVVLLVVAIGLATLWDISQLYHKVNHLQVNDLQASVGGAENILIAGSTNRCNLKVQNAQWGFCSQGVTGVNSDVIIVAHLVPSTGSISLLSIPRDTFVPNARSGAQSFKIDAALYQGPSQLVDAVEEDFGIPIQHYVEVGFDGFVNIVNAIGGIKMDFPMPVYDAEAHLKVLTPGCKLLNGVEALQVVRARHLQYKDASVTTNDYYDWPQEGQSDIARIARAHEFLKLLGSEVLARGLSNPITDQKLVDALAPQVQVDSGLNASTMITLAKAFDHTDPNSIKQFVMPISLTDFGSYYFEGYDYGDVVFPVQPNDRVTIDQFLGIDSDVDPMTGHILPKPQSINVSIVNGSGITGQATQIGDGLSSLGFRVTVQQPSGAVVSTQAQETYVYYANDATEADAMAVANDLSGYVILDEDPGQVTQGDQVSVATGTATAVIGSSNGTQPTADTPALSGESNPSPLAPPISANQTLSPWDPRACPVSQ